MSCGSAGHMRVIGFLCSLEPFMLCPLKQVVCINTQFLSFFEEDVSCSAKSVYPFLSSLQRAVFSFLFFFPSFCYCVSGVAKCGARAVVEQRTSQRFFSRACWHFVCASCVTCALLGTGTWAKVEWRHCPAKHLNVWPCGLFFFSFLLLSDEWKAVIDRGPKFGLLQEALITKLHQHLRFSGIWITDGGLCDILCHGRFMRVLFIWGATVQSVQSALWRPLYLFERCAEWVGVAVLLWCKFPSNQVVCWNSLEKVGTLLVTA